MTAKPTDLTTARKRQVRAGLRMLRQAIEACPDDRWPGGGDPHPNAFWHLAYHALFYTNLYSQRDEAAFAPWAQHRQEYQFLGRLPWPPHDPPAIDAPYTKAEVLEYWEIVDGLIDASIDGLDLRAPDCGFPWYQVPKLEHQLINLRHLQHHTGQLADRVRRVADAGTDWVSSATAAA